MPVNRLKGAHLLLLFVMFSLSSCASQPWGEIVNEQRSGETSLLYERLIEQSRSCSSAFDGELTATFDSQLDVISYGGFFQMLAPSYLKMVISNPLGQPLLAIAANDHLYQVLDTSERTFKTVTFRSFSFRNNIPPAFLEGGHLFAWLTGRPLAVDYQVGEIREDQQTRGVWLEITDRSEEPLPIEHLLLEPSGSSVRLRERIIVDPEGTFLATISYDDWLRFSSCEQPGHIMVSGLSFGAQADLVFSDLREAELKPRDFNLPFPQGYSRYYLP